MTTTKKNSFSAKQTLSVADKKYTYYSLPAAMQAGLGDINKLPFTLKILLENLLRHEDGKSVCPADIQAIVDWQKTRTSKNEIAYNPARVLMQDFTGVPAVVDLAAMRDAMKRLGGDPERINPLSNVDLVIDHSVQVDKFGTPNAFKENVDIEMQRNRERYQFLRWGQNAFDGFRVVPPGTGICHQVNLEYLAKAIWDKTIDGETLAFPDTLVGTDSHTTMINGLGVLGWGVGGIEAEAAMLGQPISMLIPEVIGFKLEGRLQDGITATDLVLTVVQMLRQKGVVGKFVEFYGAGLADLPLADRATIANMAPEYGATCGYFPIDTHTLDYMRLTGRDDTTIALVEAYCKAQDLWHDENRPEPLYTDTLTLDMNTVEPSLAGPKRPQDRVALTQLGDTVNTLIQENGKGDEINKGFKTLNEDFDMHHGDVVIAAITSCTNTSNPSVLMAAGLVAKKAVEKGLKTKPWVKTSLAPGSQVVTEYLEAAGLQPYLNQLGFELVGYGCTTCIGNSGPLNDNINQTIIDNDIQVSAVLSGNRNFEGRVHPLTKFNWLASPPLVVAYALAGTAHINLQTDPIGHNQDGEPIYLKDIWPSNQEVAQEVAKITSRMFQDKYSDVFSGDAAWKSLPEITSKTYDWDPKSTYVANPPFFDDLSLELPKINNIQGAKILALLGDSITTDHISPAGAIKADSPAGKYLQDHGIDKKDFNSFGSRRGNHEVMMRGTFANIRIRNEMVPGVEGGFTQYIPSGEQMPIYDAAMKYKQDGTPLVVIAGKEYGTGSSRDWAAKGTILLGVKAVITESFERIHRSNLIGMGVLPLQFKDGVTRKSLGLDGTETIDIVGIEKGITPHMDVTVNITKANGDMQSVDVLCRIDTDNEAKYYLNGGILCYVLRKMAR